MDSPKGIGGWLLFFCVFLLLNQVVRFVNLVVETLICIQAGRLTFAVCAYCSLSVGVAALGIVAFWMLLTRHAEAVKAAKVYLWCDLIKAACATGLGFLLAAEPAASERYAAMAWSLKLYLPVAFPYFLVWQLYFRKSVRVANTYGQASKP